MTTFYVLYTLQNVRTRKRELTINIPSHIYTIIHNHNKKANPNLRQVHNINR